MSRSRLFMLILFCFVFVFLPSASAADIEINITEDGSVLDYYGVYRIVDVEGTVTVTNTLDFQIYTVSIPMNPGTLSYDELSSTEYFTPEGIVIPTLDPGETKTFRYKIYGITTEDAGAGYREDGSSVFRFLMDDEMAYFRSDLWINLQKSDIGTVRGIPTRFITISLTNPTPLEYDIKNIQVSRTEDDDVNDPNKIWTFEDKVRIIGGDEWSREFEDNGEGMREDSVYWFIVDHELADSLIDFFEDVDLELFDETDLDEVPKSDEPNQTISDELDKPIFTRSKVFLRKIIEPGRVYPGDVINVTLITTNLDVESKTIRVKDSLPEGFELYEVYSQDSLLSRDNLIWEINVNRDTSKVITYAVRFTDSESIGLDYFPEAEASFDDGRITSSRVPVIKRFIPQKKLYIQKNVRRMGSEVVEITLSVRNLGEASLSDILVKDFLASEDMFSEITKEPESKGLWRIESLGRDQVWQVVYKTDSNQNIQRLPQVFGIDEVHVLKTLMMDNFISNYIFSPSISTIEFVGLIAVIIFPFFMIFWYRRKMLKKSGGVL
ncbi:MAG: hypothetical protein ACOC32_01270 [Nanoarchaeota archaeon]